MHLERADGGDQHDAVGHQAGVAALDIEELLRSQVGAEAGLGDAIVAELEGHASGLHGVAAVSDVGERAAVDDGRRVLEGLHQVGHEGVLEQDRHGARHLDVLSRDLAAPQRGAHDDAIQAGLEVFHVGGQAEDGHDLRRHRDVEAGLALDAFSALSDGDLPQRPIVQVDHPGPGDVVGVDVEFVTLEEMVVEHGRAQIVGRGDGVDIAGEVEVDVLHRHDLGIAAPGRPALDAEARAEGWLAQRGDSLLADLVEAHGKTDVGRGLALAGRGRSDGRAEYELAIRAVSAAGRERPGGSWPCTCHRRPDRPDSAPTRRPPR